MLKIKSDIDLKELEKYGFWQWENIWCTNTTKKSLTSIDDFDISLYEYDRIIDCDEEADLNVLYDLIKDGLVVKVDD